MLDELCELLKAVDRDEVAKLAGILHESQLIYFLGNGGSAAIAQHMATDWMKVAGIPSHALNDAAMLTMTSNDYGHQQMFAWPLQRYLVNSPDQCTVVCISSSGRSPNILAAARNGLTYGCTVIAFTGFDADNPLRELSNHDLHVPSFRYPVVEAAHLAILSEMCDIKYRSKE